MSASDTYEKFIQDIAEHCLVYNGGEKIPKIDYKNNKDAIYYHVIQVINSHISSYVGDSDISFFIEHIKNRKIRLNMGSGKVDIHDILYTIARNGIINDIKDLILVE